MITEKKVFQEMKIENDGTAVWTLPKDLPYFDGHFPGNPIFPAVGIVDATVFLLQSRLNGPEVYVSHFPVAKFLSPIQPGQTVRIELKKLNNKEWLAEWKDEAAVKLLATLRFQM